MQAMFATQINNVVEDELVVRFCLMKIIDYTVNAVKDKTWVHSTARISLFSEEAGRHEKGRVNGGHGMKGDGSTGACC